MKQIISYQITGLSYGDNITYNEELLLSSFDSLYFRFIF